MNKKTIKTNMNISGNCMTSWIAFGDKDEVFKLLEDYLGVKEMGFGEDGKYNYPVNVNITATKNKLVIERLKEQEQRKGKW